MDQEEEQISEADLPEGIHPVDEEGEIIDDTVVDDIIDPLAIDPLLPKEEEDKEEEEILAAEEEEYFFGEYDKF